MCFVKVMDKSVLVLSIYIIFKSFQSINCLKIINFSVSLRSDKYSLKMFQQVKNITLWIPPQSSFVALWANDEFSFSKIIYYFRFESSGKNGTKCQKTEENDVQTTAHTERTVILGNVNPACKHPNRKLIDFLDKITDRKQAIQHRIKQQICLDYLISILNSLNKIQFSSRIKRTQYVIMGSFNINTNLSSF